MILLHRLTSFAVAAVSAAGFLLIILSPSYTWWAMLGLLALIPLLFARLLTWDFKHFSFWIFLGTPLLTLISSLFLFLFLEGGFFKWSLALVVTGALWLYAENLFSFYHLPSTYQAYSLEYLSLVLYLISAFLFTSGSYGVQIFLQLPAWVPALAVFWATLFSTIGVFWVSKVGSTVTTRFAIAGSIMLTELYLVLAMLPTSFMTNAAIFTTALYLFLGLSRAHVLDKLTSTVLKRYLITGGLLLIVVFATSRWI
jgi:hypothetical protein